MGYEGLGGVVPSRGHVQFFNFISVVRGLECSWSHVIILSGCRKNTIFVFFRNFVYVEGGHETPFAICKIHNYYEKTLTYA